METDLGGIREPDGGHFHLGLKYSSCFWRKPGLESGNTAEQRENSHADSWSLCVTGSRRFT